MHNITTKHTLFGPTKINCNLFSYTAVRRKRSRRTSTMTLTNLHSHPPPDDPDPQAKGRIIVSHVRMNVTQKEGVKTLSIPSTLHKILNSIRDVDNKVTFEDIQRKSFSLKMFPSDKEKFDQAFGTVIKNGRSTQVILGFTIKSSNTLGALKQAILPVLQRCSTFLRPHVSNTWERLDTITIGHLHLVHPTFADAEVLKQKIKNTTSRNCRPHSHHSGIPRYRTH
jgi:hypothetical protein